MFRLFYSGGIQWRLTHLLISPDYLRNTATNTKFIIFLFFLYTGRTYFIHYSLFSYLSELFNINRNIYNWKETKEFHSAIDDKQQQRRRYRAVSKLEMNNNTYGNPPWKTRAALQFRPLRRDFCRIAGGPKQH